MLYICYLLLTFTVVIRNHEWLAACAAASVMTYSGVAAIHLMVLFATNNKASFPKAKSHCESIFVPSTNAPFLACAGVDEPDIDGTVIILTSVMLGALPMAAWSNTFRKSTNKAILISWLLILAVAHTFFPLTTTHSNAHFQICSKDNIEPLPTADFQAPTQGQPWYDSFHQLLSPAQRSSSPFRNDSAPGCIYSCFATTGYLGRKTRDIGVLPISPPRWNKAVSHRNIIMFWWAYTFLALVTYITTEQKGWHPEWAHKSVLLLRYRQQPFGSRWDWKSVTNISIKRTSHIDNASQPLSVTIQITILRLVQLFTQFVSVSAFCGSVIYQETRRESAVELEPFAAVGQWGNVVVVLLVLLAAGLSRIWAGRGARSSAEETWSLEEGSEELLGGATEKEDWDSRVGYAS
ncbi:MAG: hypothetical protein Q9199_003840 [Rusavskia elegans]